MKYERELALHRQELALETFGRDLPLPEDEDDEPEDDDEVAQDIVSRMFGSGPPPASFTREVHVDQVLCCTALRSRWCCLALCCAALHSVTMPCSHGCTAMRSQVVDWTLSPYDLTPLRTVAEQSKTWLQQQRDDRGDDAVAAGLLDYTVYHVHELYLEQRFAFELVQHRATPLLEAMRDGTQRPFVEPMIIDGFGGTGHPPGSMPASRPAACGCSGCAGLPLQVSLTCSTASPRSSSAGRRRWAFRRFTRWRLTRVRPPLLYLAARCTACSSCQSTRHSFRSYQTMRRRSSRRTFGQ